jgi:hypothetical protein
VAGCKSHAAAKETEKKKKKKKMIQKEMVEAK